MRILGRILQIVKKKYVRGRAVHHPSYELRPGPWYFPGFLFSAILSSQASTADHAPRPLRTLVLGSLARLATHTAIHLLAGPHVVRVNDCLAYPRSIAPAVLHEQLV